MTHFPLFLLFMASLKALFWGPCGSLDKRLYFKILKV